MSASEPARRGAGAWSDDWAATDLLESFRRTPWRLRAACRHLDTRIFYSGQRADTRAALQACGVCPVREECLADTNRVDDFGNAIRGGMTPAARCAARVAARQRARQAS